MRNLIILLTKYYSVDQIENNVSRACSTFWGGEEGFGGET